MIDIFLYVISESFLIIFTLKTSTMTTTSFEEEFQEFFKKLDTPLKKYINEHYNKSSKKKYSSFLKVFLLDFGIYAFDSFPYNFDSKYTPFINCQEKNIFNLKEGITDLTNKPLPIRESERKVAEFLIEQFNKTPLRTFKNWHKN